MSRSVEIDLQPDVLLWARERVGLEPEDLARKMSVKPERVSEWERSGKISISQADRLARYTHTPVGALYLTEPPEDRLSIPDFRTVGNLPLPRPSPDLLETVQIMQRRQAWMHEELIEDGVEPLAFIKACSLDFPPAQKVADAIRDTLHLARNWAEKQDSWADALRHLRDRVEDAGVLVVFNGIVNNNTHRKLDPEEFRGFALVDEYAPLIFINGADFKAAQTFTLAHELAHLFIGAEGVSNFEDFQPVPNATEQFCDKVAAEFLVPEDNLRIFWADMAEVDDPYQAIARKFKVSTLVAARRALDLALISRETFFQFYQAYQNGRQRDKTSGGNFWNNQNVRIGHRFGIAVVRAVKEGRLFYREAYSLTGLKANSFDQFVKRMDALP